MIPLLSLLLTSPTHADEGMWLPEQLPELSSELKAMGLELPASELADPARAPLGAIVGLGFCSASFVSADGLIGTNHHCVEGYLQYASDDTHDRATDGMIAASRAEELWAGPTARLYIVEQIDDVTPRVLAPVKKLRKTSQDAERYQAVERAKSEIVAECEATPNRRCEVATYWGGREFRLITRRVIKDVRLVYAPPMSVGSFGGEIDNWMWPRHAGDFAFVRAYVAPDGSSAEHSPDNVPYRPPHHLKIDRSGASPGEMVMVAGYPGSTYRHRTPHTMRYWRDRGYAFKVNLYGELVDMLTEEAAKSEAASSRLTGPISWVGNSQKYAEGMLDGFQNSGVVETKEAQWQTLVAWVGADKKRQKQYQAAIDEVVALEMAMTEGTEAETLVSWLVYMSDPLTAAWSAWRLASERKKPDLERESGYQDRDIESLQDDMQRMEKTMWLPAERRGLDTLLQRIEALPADQAPGPILAWLKQNGGRAAALDALYNAPALAETDARLALLEADRDALASSADPWVKLAVAIDAFDAPLRAADRAREGAMLRVAPVYLEALAGALGGRMYPDANNTLRLTFGHVKGYSPADAVVYLPQTTAAGILPKAGPAPFDAPERLLAAIPGAPKSRWADPDLGDVPVNFTTTLDTTGGNSGSATLNARGELVGYVFDGNYESMSADWLFDDAVTRSIHVDIRYVLWLLESVEGGGWIAEELLRD